MNDLPVTKVIIIEDSLLPSKQEAMLPINDVMRAVTKISSCRVYAVSRWGTEQVVSSFGLILLFFVRK